MSHAEAFRKLSPTTLADVLTRANVLDSGIRPLWTGMPRVAGPAFPVRCPPGDHLMLHAAIHRAPAGSIVVVECGDVNYALAGGNVCAVAQKRGIQAFVLDGALRDLGEVRERRFPVFARAVIPIPGVPGVGVPGVNERLDIFNGPIVCGGATVSPGDLVVADEEGIVVIPAARATEVLKSAQARAEKDAAETLEHWEAAHCARIDEILRQKGFTV